MIFFQIVGVVVIALLVVLTVLFIVYKIFKKEIKSLITAEKMPVLLPLPIPTKNRPFLMRLLVWLFDIRKWQLVENWHFEIEKGPEIVIPKDFKFDGASIPRIFWAILSPVGLLLIPGLIHDYGYRFNLIWQKTATGEIAPYMEDVGQKDWDDLFRRVGVQVNGFAIIDYIAWLGLRIGGCFAWNKHREADQTPVPPEL